MCDVRLLYGGGSGGNGFKKLAKYLTKNSPLNAKRWTGSQNLKRPIIERIYTSINKAMYNAIISAVICREYRELAAIVKRFFGVDYTFTSCDTAENPVLQGINIYFKLWKETPPDVELCH